MITRETHAMHTNRAGIRRIRDEVGTPTHRTPDQHSLRPEAAWQGGAVRTALLLTHPQKLNANDRRTNMLCRPMSLVSIVSETRLAQKNGGKPFDSTASSISRIERSVHKKRVTRPRTENSNFAENDSRTPFFLCHGTSKGYPSVTESANDQRYHGAE
jgi:hypothetical protein